MTVDGGATNHNIVHNGEAALATDIIADAIADPGIRENSSFVKIHASAVFGLREWDFIRVEPIPNGPVDDLIRGESEDVDNRIRAIENTGILREVCKCKH
jgi:hypothetical protein